MSKFGNFVIQCAGLMIIKHGPKAVVAVANKIDEHNKKVRPRAQSAHINALDKMNKLSISTTSIPEASAKALKGRSTECNWMTSRK